MLKAFRHLIIPDGAPIVIVFVPEKGWGCFATRSISKGSVILAEQPWFTVKKPQEDIREKDIQKCYKKLPAEQKRLYLGLALNGYYTKLETFVANTFSITPESHYYADTEHVKFGFYPISSRLNHSCLPNSRFAADSQTIQAIKDIAQGGEITFSYSPAFDYKTTSERHSDLGFVCRCEACNPATAFHYLSDMRRRLIHGLSYLVTGTTINGVRDTSQSPIIVDAKLKKMAEQGKLSVAFLGTCFYIRALLLEVEGLRSVTLFQSYVGAALSVAVRSNAINKIPGPEVSRMAILNARYWMGKASEIVRHMLLPGQQDLANFRKNEQLFWSGDVTVQKWRAAIR